MNETNMTLLTDWKGQCVDGWGWSEKLDGCRAFWDGFQFWTRGGHIVPAPADFIAAMPAGVRLDGEIYCGRGTLVEASEATRRGTFTSRTRFVAFDAPDATGNWHQRIAAARRALKNNRIANAVKSGVIRCYAEMNHIACNIIYTGGEGIVMRNPAVNFYERGRTENALRLKA